MNKISLSTTGIISSITINDLYASIFTHPSINLILVEENSHNYPYTLDEIKNSDDLQTAIDNGYIVLKDENDIEIPIIKQVEIELYNPIINNFTNAKHNHSNDTTGGVLENVTVPIKTTLERISMITHVGLIVYDSNYKSIFSFDGESWIEN